MIIAQASIESLPPGFLKSLTTACILAIMVGCAVIGSVMVVLQYLQSKRAAREPQTREITPQPLQVETTKGPKRYNKDLDEQRHNEIGRRLDGHDSEIDSLWNTLRSEDEATRREIRLYIEKTNLSLGRIEGALGTLPKD